MTNLILETLGLTYLNPLEAEVALRRITNDSFALKRAQEICLSQFLPAAIQSLLPIEKAALVKRCNVAPPFTQPVTWHINDSHDQNGDYFGLTANCPTCRQSSSWNCPPLAFSGGRLPETFAEINATVEALNFEHCGRKESAPPSGKNQLG
jgi:hypothetical protein